MRTVEPFTLRLYRYSYVWGLPDQDKYVGLATVSLYPPGCPREATAPVPGPTTRLALCIRQIQTFMFIYDMYQTILSFESRERTLAGSRVYPLKMA